MANDGGVSFVAVNSMKGEHLLALLDTSIIKTEENYALAINTQDNLNGGRAKPDNYEQFWNDYRNNGFLFVAKKYGSYSFSGRIRTRIVQFMRKIGILQCIKKMTGK